MALDETVFFLAFRQPDFRLAANLLATQMCIWRTTGSIASSADHRQSTAKVVRDKNEQNEQTFLTALLTKQTIQVKLSTSH